MKKLIVFFSILSMVVATMNVFGQTPNKASVSSKITTATSANRQMQRGDSQMSKANQSYQRAQTGPTTTSVNRNSNSSTRVSSASSSSNRQNSASSNASKQSTVTRTTTVTKPTTTSTSAAKPTAPSSTTVKPANVSSSNSATMNSNKINNNVTIRQEVSSKPNTSAVKPQTSAASTTVTSSAISKSSNTIADMSSKTASANSNTMTKSADALSKRGYDEIGQAQPQIAPEEAMTEKSYNYNRNNGYQPYAHPNNHNFGGHITVPSRIRPVYYGGIPYYYYNSVFCTMMNGYYVVCRPPLGAVIAHAIFHTWRPVIVIHNNVRYYYDDGTFYMPRYQDYVVVAPPIGARIAELPSNYQTIILEGRVYFKVDNVYYKEVVVNGYLWYEVLFVA